MLLNHISKSSVRVFSIGPLEIIVWVAVSVVFGTSFGGLVGLFIRAAGLRRERIGMEVYWGVIFGMMLILPSVILWGSLTGVLYNAFGLGLWRASAAALMLFIAGAAQTILLLCAGTAGGLAGLLLKGMLKTAKRAGLPLSN